MHTDSLMAPAGGSCAQANDGRLPQTLCTLCMFSTFKQSVASSVHSWPTNGVVKTPAGGLSAA